MVFTRGASGRGAQRRHRWTHPRARRCAADATPAIWGDRTKRSRAGQLVARRPDLTIGWPADGPILLGEKWRLGPYARPESLSPQIHRSPVGTRTLCL